MKIQVLPLREDNPSVTLTTYLHEDGQAAVRGLMRPAVIVCPGGGYLNCSPREGEPVALRFAAMGYHAFVLRYSVLSDDPEAFPGDGDIVPDPARVYPAALRDLGRAFLTIRAHAEEWQVDADSIAILGFSAGAHNCAMYAVYWNAPVLTEYFGQPAERFRPAAVILGYGSSDYFYRRSATWTDPFAERLHRASNTAFLGTPDPSDALVREVSPSLHVGAHTPPAFLWATGEDSLVPVENSTRMATALAQAGVPFELHVFERGMHGLSLADQSTADSRITVNADVAKWVPLCEAWLQKRFALSLPEKPFWMP